MKDSILIGAANAAGVQSKNNSPSGSTRQSALPKTGVNAADKRSTRNMRQVVISNEAQKPRSVANSPIGLNMDTKD